MPGPPSTSSPIPQDALSSNGVGGGDRPDVLTRRCSELCAYAVVVDPPEERGYRARNRQVTKRRSGSCRKQLGLRVGAGADADTLSADSPGRGNVLGRVTDDHDTTLGQRKPQLPGTSRSSDAQELRPIFGIAPKAPKIEQREEADGGELDPGSVSDIARSESHCEPRVTGLGDRVSHAWENPVSSRIRVLDLLSEEGHVRVEDGVDRTRRDFRTNRLETPAHDGSIGHAVEPKRRTSVVTVVDLQEGPLDRPATRTRGADQGAVEVEQQDRWRSDRRVNHTAGL